MTENPTETFSCQKTGCDPPPPSFPPSPPPPHPPGLVFRSTSNRKSLPDGLRRRQNEGAHSLTRRPAHTCVKRGGIMMTLCAGFPEQQFSNPNIRPFSFFNKESLCSLCPFQIVISYVYDLFFPFCLRLLFLKSRTVLFQGYQKSLQPNVLYMMIQISCSNADLACTIIRKGKSKQDDNVDDNRKIICK